MGTSSGCDKRDDCNGGHGVAGKDRLPRDFLRVDEEDENPYFGSRMCISAFKISLISSCLSFS